MSNYSGKESQYICSRVPKPGSDPLIGSGWESGRDSWYQSLGLGVSGKSPRFLMHLHRMCWPNADIFVLFIV